MSFLILCPIFSTVAHAQTKGPPGPTGNFTVPTGQGGKVLKGDNLFSNVFEEFHSAVTKWYPVMKNAAVDLFWSLAAISMVWTFGQLALGGADLGKFFSEFIRFVVFIGFNWFLLDKAGGNLGELGRMIFDTFGQLGSQASNYHHDIMNPGIMFDRGWTLFVRCMMAADDLDWDEIGQYIALVGLGYGILILAAIISINVLMVMITYWFASYAGIFILGFGGSRWTSDMAINYYRSLLGIGIQLLGMVLVIDVGDRVVNTYITSLYAAGVKTQSLGVIVVVMFCIWKISTTVPGLLAGMLSGHSQTGVSNTGHGLAGTAASLGIGLATAGAGLAAMGGANLLKGGSGSGGADAGSGGEGGAGAKGSSDFFSAFNASSGSGDEAKALANSVPDMGSEQMQASKNEKPDIGVKAGSGGESGQAVDASNDGDSSIAGGVGPGDAGPDAAVADLSNDGDSSTGGGVDVGDAKGDLAADGGVDVSKGDLAADGGVKSSGEKGVALSKGSSGSGKGSGGGVVPAGGAASAGSAKGSGSTAAGSGAGGAKGSGGGKGGNDKGGKGGAKDGMTDAQKKMHSIGQSMFEKGSKQAMAALVGNQAANAIGMGADALGASANAAWEKIQESRGGGSGADKAGGAGSGGGDVGGKGGAAGEVGGGAAGGHSAGSGGGGSDRTDDGENIAALAPAQQDPGSGSSVKPGVSGGAKGTAPKGQKGQVGIKKREGKAGGKISGGGSASGVAAQTDIQGPLDMGEDPPMDMGNSDSGPSSAPVAPAPGPAAPSHGPVTQAPSPGPSSAPVAPASGVVAPVVDLSNDGDPSTGGGVNVGDVKPDMGPEPPPWDY